MKEEAGRDVPTEGRSLRVPFSITQKGKERNKQMQTDRESLACVIEKKRKRERERLRIEKQEGETARRD